MSASIEQIPHYSSRAVLLSAVAEAPLVGGTYTFSGQWESLALQPRLSRGLYVVTDFSFGADVSELDWQAAWTTIPNIRFGLEGGAYASIFRDPIPLGKYSDGTAFREAIEVHQEPSELKFRMQGELVQTPNLVGKASIRAVFTLVAYAISDDHYIRAFKEGFGK